MPSCNRVYVMGNVTRDPELKNLQSGAAVLDLGLAVNERYKDKSGQSVEKTVFLDVVVWEQQARNAAQYLRKGSPVFVEGRLQMDEWTTKEGEKRTKLRIKADHVQFLSSGKREERSGSDRPVSNGSVSGSDLHVPVEEETPF